MQIINFDELAKQYMLEIMYDNGLPLTGIGQTEAQFLHPEHQRKISIALQKFCAANPNYDITTEETITLLGSGEAYEVEKTFAHLPEFAQLHQALNDYFDNM